MKYLVRFSTPLAFREEDRVRYLTRKRIGCSVMTTDINKALRYDRKKAHEHAGRFNAANDATGTKAEVIPAPKVLA